MTAAPLLELRAAVLRGPAGDEVALPDFALGERCLALLGDFSALFAWLGGARERVAGAARVRGEDARAALLAGRVGLAPRELPWEPHLGVFDALVLSVELSGAPRTLAREAARATVDWLGLLPLCPRRTSTLSPVERSAVALAHAALPVLQEDDTMAPPAVLALEAPLVPGDDRDALLGLVDRLAERAALLIGVPQGRSGGTEVARLLARADAVAELAFGALVHAGPPPRERVAARAFRVEALARWPALEAELRARSLGVALIDAPSADGAATGVVTLGEGADARAVVAAAVAAGAPLGELVPLGEREPWPVVAVPTVAVEPAAETQPPAADAGPS